LTRDLIDHEIDVDASHPGSEEAQYDR
jgi:hypothetical protein